MYPAPAAGQCAAIHRAHWATPSEVGVSAIVLQRTDGAFRYSKSCSPIIAFTIVPTASTAAATTFPRATLSVSELVDLTIEFYRRNYIEGLFLSSGVVRNPDYTMERLVRVAKDLRLIHRFNGYIHLKSIPGASRELVNEAGLYADRLSVNIEIPKEENLKLLAPEKDHQSVYRPMHYIQQGVLTNKEDRKKFRHTPRFAPADKARK